MQLYNLDTKITNKSNEILKSYIQEQNELSNARIGEIRTKCRSILEKNGILEDRKNGIVYQKMENELKKLQYNIDYFKENNLEEITKNQIENNIENVNNKIDCLEQNTEFTYLKSNVNFNKAYNENNIKNLLFSYFENYKANTISTLLENGYSQNTIDNIENDILNYVTSQNSDILTEKITQDSMKSCNALNNSLDILSQNILNEAEARFKCQASGMIYDELSEKREIVKQKYEKIEDLIYQINNMDFKFNQASQEKV